MELAVGLTIATAVPLRVAGMNAMQRKAEERPAEEAPQQSPQKTSNL
ncbi:MAG: hypothetical protein AAF830_04210 [Pseudomonadota bacterium]